MEVQPQAEDMEEVTTVEVAIDQDRGQVHDQVFQVDQVIHTIHEDHIIQDGHDMEVTVDTVATADTDQDGHITGGQDVDGSAVNIGTGITVDGCHTGHSHTHFQVTAFIRPLT